MHIYIFCMLSLSKTSKSYNLHNKAKSSLNISLLNAEAKYHLLNKNNASINDKCSNSETKDISNLKSQCQILSRGLSPVDPHRT